VRPLLVLLAGCGFQHGVVAGSDGGDSNGPIDAAIDAPPDAFDPRCFGKSPFTVCLSSVPNVEVTLPTSLNTSTCTSIGGAIAMVSGVEACVFAGTNVYASGSLVGVFGSRPLVVVATDTIVVSTTSFDITSRSRNPASDGPNANPPQCAIASTQNGVGSNGGGGGGAGGSFGTAGSSGGNGNGGTSAGGVAAAPATTFDVLRGGCRGGIGGAGQDQTAPGGSGGGALYLVARSAIMVTGTINASGAGGFGGLGSRGGAGGGGSGGMIVMHAPTLSLSAGSRVFANGGGGGGGAGNSSNDGSDGSDALTADTPAPGGVAGDIQGTAGAAGAFKSTAPSAVTQAAQGGGGGGGGAGVIRILSGQAVAPINVSPTPILN
jgi:hypothetical protein